MHIRPRKPTRDDPALPCPRHGGSMRRFDVHRVVVDRCVVCGGIWLDLGEIRALLELPADARHDLHLLDRGGSTADPPTGIAPVCPRDRTPLLPVRDARQPHIEYDLCVKCGGVFFDAGELADLGEFTLRERVAWLFKSWPRKDADAG